MAGLEVEDTAIAPLEAATGAEDFTGIVPANEHQLLGFGDGKGLGVAFLMGDLKMQRQALGNGMGRIGHEYPLTGIVVPAQVAGGAAELAEDGRNGPPPYPYRT